MGLGRAGGGRVRRALRVSEGRAHVASPVGGSWGPWTVSACGGRDGCTGGLGSVGAAHAAHVSHVRRLCHSLAEEREVREVPIMGVLFSGLLELRNLEFCPCFEGTPIGGFPIGYSSKDGQNSKFLNFEFWAQEEAPRAGHGQGRRGTTRDPVQATTRQRARAGAPRAPPALSAKATSARFAAAAVTASPALAARAAPRPGSVLGLWGLVLGLGSGLGLRLELGLG